MRPTKKYIWEYNVSNLDLSDLETLHWYLERKINFGDWAALNRRILKKQLPYLKIDKYLKEILSNFLKIYG